ncbi:hypothetical protein [Methylobacterium tarhaniae]|uniref:hypothetical protein n=1 Tax=Methylobacterium tarhaniae TaxID=1187852 RepID=UPI003D00D3DB
MAEGKERTQRRVYVLPTELVERIVAFQAEMGISSEVEAARRLLDDALKQRDTFRTITTKLIEKNKELRSLREAASAVLANHPLVTEIKFEEGSLTYTLKNSMCVQVYDYNKATVFDDRNNVYDFDYDLDEMPEWASHRHPRPKPKTTETANKYNELDDDIPF